MPRIRIITQPPPTVDLSDSVAAISLQAHTLEHGKGRHIPSRGITDAEVDSISQVKIAGLLDALALLGGDQGSQWSVITSAQPLALNRYYAVNGDSLLSLELPSNPSTGDRLTLYSMANTTFRLQQTLPTDLIQVGDKLTTMGASGAIESVGPGNCMALVYLADRWIGTVLQGNFEVV